MELPALPRAALLESSLLLFLVLPNGPLLEIQGPAVLDLAAFLPQRLRLLPGLILADRLPFPFARSALLLDDPGFESPGQFLKAPEDFLLI
jgi:hypothetical protein